MAKVKLIMKKNLFVAAARLVAMTSCVQEADVVTPQEGEKVVVEFTAGVQTKAILNGTVVTWEADDVISVNGTEFTISEVDGLPAISEDKITAKFSAAVDPKFLENDSFTAVYPATAANWEDGLVVTVPEAQSGSADVVAVATVSSIEEALVFDHVASFFKFQVPEAVTTITLSATEPLAGTINNVAFATENDVTTVSYGVVGDGEKTITLSLAEGAMFQPETYYYAAVLPGVKTNLELSFDGKVYKTWASVNIKQSMIANVKPKAERNLAFTAAEATATMGDNSFTGLVLSGEKTGVTYTSSQTSVATVDAEGKVTLVSPGTTVITASAEENNTHLAGSASYTLTVSPAPKVDRGLAFSAATATATYGQPFTAPTLSGVKDGVTYSSSNPNVATVSSTGIVTLKAAGKTTITAQAAENDTHLAETVSYELTVNHTLYLKPNVNWKQDGARFAAYFFGENNVNTWVNMNDSNSDGIFEVAIPTDKNYSYVIFCRMKNGSTTNDFESTVWNKTKDQTIQLEATKNYFVIKNGSWSEDQDDTWMTTEDAINYINYLYLKPNANWTSNNSARFAAYFYVNDNDNSWASMTQVGSTGVYQVAIPDDRFKNVIFCRMNKDNSTNSWENKNDQGPFWNQTNNLTIPTNGNNKYTISEGAWSKGNGSWSKY